MKTIAKDFLNFCNEHDMQCKDCEYKDIANCDMHFSYDKGFRACAIKIYEIFCENKKDIEGIAVIDLSNELLKLCGNIQS